MKILKISLIKKKFNKKKFFRYKINKQNKNVKEY